MRYNKLNSEITVRLYGYSISIDTILCSEIFDYIPISKISFYVMELTCGFLYGVSLTQT
jgi:hypothetical protein